MPYSDVTQLSDYSLLALQKFKKDESFRRLTRVFNDPASAKEDVITAGEQLLLKVYGGKDEITLDKLDLTRLCQKVAASMKVVSPESLPPTSAVASLHSLRVYHQVQIWRDRQDLDPEACSEKGKAATSLHHESASTCKFIETVQM